MNKLRSHLQRTIKIFSFLMVFAPCLALAQGSSSQEYLSNSNNLFVAPGTNSANFQDALLKKIRVQQQKEQIQLLQDTQNVKAIAAALGVAAKPSASLVNLLAAASPTDQDKAKIYAWFAQNQQAHATGLVASYPQDPNVGDQAFTYDQAVAGIVMLQQGDTQGAKKIFDFYNGAWNGNGYYTVYNANIKYGSQVEYRVIMGPNAWIGLFCLQYYSKVTDATEKAKALSLATTIGKWIQSALPHKDGGVAMSYASDSIFGKLFSVENDLDYYALASALSTKAAASSDRALFLSEKNSLAVWFKTKAYNPATGLFKRGLRIDGAGNYVVDPTPALDSNSWAILVFGGQGLIAEGVQYPAVLADNIRKTFLVQNNGSFGGDVSTAKGFDFSDATNAQFSNGRTGVKWVEGTNQMIVAYQTLASYYKAVAAQSGGVTLLVAISDSNYFANAASSLMSRNQDELISTNGTESYSYTDPAGIEPFSDSGYTTSAGPSVAATAWAYFSLAGFNPFQIS